MIKILHLCEFDQNKTNRNMDILQNAKVYMNFIHISWFNINHEPITGVNKS